MDLNATIFAQYFAFLAFVFSFYRFGWPELVAALKARQAKIARGLENARQAKKSLALAHSQAEETLQAVKAESRVLLARAQQQSNELLSSTRRKAEEEAERIVASGQATLERERLQVQKSLEQSAAHWVIDATQHILEAMGPRVDEAHIAHVLKAVCIADPSQDGSEKG